MKIGPRPAGDRLTPEDDTLLPTMICSKTPRAMIARKLKRSPAAITKRIIILKKRTAPERPVP
jgi:hypothetical protein